MNGFRAGYSRRPSHRLTVIDRARHRHEEDSTHQLAEAHYGIEDAIVGASIRIL
jgi:hypothetical protein